MAQFTTKGKIVGIVLILAIVGVGLWYLNGSKPLSQMIPTPSGKVSASTPGTIAPKAPGKLTGVLNTWGGYGAILYFNDGLISGPNSRFKKDYDLEVDLKKIDVFSATRAAWKSDEVDFLCFCTIDEVPTEIEGWMPFNPKIIGQVDWSYGGDFVWARDGITTVADLKGKTIAVAVGTPSHTLLINLLAANGMTTADVIIKEVADGIEAADFGKKRVVEAVVGWSPDDEDLIAAVGGSVLYSTKKANRIIADVIVVKESVLNAKRAQFTALLDGWMRSAAEINTDPAAKQHAAEIMSIAFNFPADWCLKAINNAQLSTYHDNVNFFNLNGTYTGVTGEALYNKMAVIYSQITNKKGQYLAPPSVPSWRVISDPSIIRALSHLATQPGQQAAAEPTFSPAVVKASRPIASKSATITFATNSAELSSEAKYTIDLNFADIAKMFANAAIRIEGNTDNAGTDEINIPLSERRAQAVADYLVYKYHFDRNKFDVRGNGSRKPVASNDTSAGRQKNRRTDLELLTD